MYFSIAESITNLDCKPMRPVEVGHVDALRQLARQ
jgi:hypothetical protein